MRFSATLVTAGALATCALADVLPVSFKPTDLPISSAPCRALNRHTNETKDISIEYVEVNPHGDRTLLMVHGWPSLWHSWKYQIEEFKNDYRIIAVNQRGFGGSTTSGDVGSSATWYDLVEDLTCVLEHVQVAKAVCMGHDWGTQICYEAARMRPDLFEAVIGSVIPYMPMASDKFIPMSALVPQVPKLAYQLFLADFDAASKELNQDVRRTLRATLRTVASPPPDTFLADSKSYMAAWNGVKEIPPIPFLTTEEEDYWVQQYDIQEFKPTLGFYAIGDRELSWEFDHAQANYTIPQPILSLLPENDPVANWVFAAKLLGSDKFLPSLTTKTLPGAHWVQLEHPVEFNAIVKEWLDNLSKAAKKRDVAGHLLDEL